MAQQLLYYVGMMKKCNYIFILLFLIVATACGGGSGVGVGGGDNGISDGESGDDTGGEGAAPTTPAQIPTTITFSASKYASGAIFPLQETVTATADADFSGTVEFYSNGQLDTSNACGAYTADGETISIAVADTWPNLSSQCSVRFRNSDDTYLPITITEPSSSLSSYSKDVLFAESAVTEVTAYYDVSITAVNDTLELEDLGDILSDSAKNVTLDISKLGPKIYGCYSAGNSGDPNEIIFVTSADDGETFTAEKTLVSSNSQWVGYECDIETMESSSGDTVIAVVISAYSRNCEGGISCDGTMLFTRSTDGGDTFSSLYTAQSLGAVSDAMFEHKLDQNGVSHIIFYNGNDIILTAISENGILDADTLIKDASPSVTPVIAINGENIYVSYVVDSDPPSFLFQALIYENDLYTANSALSVYPIQYSTDIYDIKLTTDINGRPIITWVKWDIWGDHNLYLSIYDSTTHSISDPYQIDAVGTVASDILEFRATYSNNLTFCYRSTITEGGIQTDKITYRLAKLADSVDSLSEEKYLDVPDTSENASKRASYSAIEGRLHYYYTSSDYKIYITKITF